MSKIENIFINSVRGTMLRSVSVVAVAVVFKSVRLTAPFPYLVHEIATALGTGQQACVTVTWLCITCPDILFNLRLQ